MNEAPMDALVRDWMRSSMAPEPDPYASAAAVLRRLEAVDAGQALAPRRRTGATVTLLWGAAVLSAVAVLAGTLLTTTDGKRSSTPDRPAVGAVASERPTSVASEPATRSAIHWRSDEVDWRADGMTLRVGDEVYTGKGATYSVEAVNEGSQRWRISPSWVEADMRHELTIAFEADPRGWWIAGVELDHPDVIGRDGRRHQAAGWLQVTSPDRFPLGTAYEGPWRAEGTLEVPVCTGSGIGKVEASLEFEALHLAVRPHDRTMLDDVMDRLGAASDDLAGALEQSDPSTPPLVELECPPPRTESLAVGGFTLEVEPLGDGLARVFGDGVHDLDESIRDVAVTDDGRVLLAAADRLMELGSPSRRPDTTAVMRQLARVDLAADGSPIIRGGDGKADRSHIALGGADGWVLLPAFEHDGPGGGTRRLIDPVVAADGSLWVGFAGGLGRFDGDEWTSVSRRDTSPRATARYQHAYGPTDLVATSAGELWTGIGHTLSRYRDGAWTEHAPLDEHIESILEALEAPGFSATMTDVEIGADDTLWAFVRIRPEGARRNYEALVRFADDTWSVHPLDDVAPGLRYGATDILVDDDGAVLLLLRARRQTEGSGPAGARLVRYDGKTARELARLSGGSSYRLADVGPDGSVWLIGRTGWGPHDERLHVVVGAGAGEP